MICPSCGKEGRGRFCTNCGARLEEEAPASERAPAAPDVNVTAVVPPGGFAGAEMGRDRREEGQAPDTGSTQRFSSSAPRMGAPTPDSGPSADGGAAQTHADRSERPVWSGAADRSSFGGGFAGESGAMAMQPMTLGQVVSGTFSIVQAHAMQFLGVAAAYTLAMFVAFVAFGLALAAAGVTSVLTGGLASLGSAILAALLGGLVLLAVAVVAGAVAACAYINIARGAEPVRGNDPVVTTVEILQRAWRDSPRLLLALLVLAGIWIAAAIVVGVIAAVFTQISGALAFLVYLCWMVVAIWLGVSLIFVPQAAVLDRADPVESLRHSMNLVSGYWWRTFGFLIVAWLIGLGIYIGGFIVIAILGLIFSHIPVLGGLITSLLYAMILALFYAFYITFGTLMFYDLKARKAGSTRELAPA